MEMILLALSIYLELIFRRTLKEYTNETHLSTRNNLKSESIKEIKTDSKNHRKITKLTQILTS